MIKSNKRATETFLVAKATPTTLATTGSTLTNSSTGLVNIADGQLGFLFFKTPSFTAAAETFRTGAAVTVSNLPELSILQGLPEANQYSPQNPYPLSMRRYKKSNAISPSSYVIATKQAFTEARHEAWLLNPGTFAVEDTTEYELFLNVIFHRNRIFSSSTQNGGLRVLNITPEFASGLANNLKIDWLLQHTAWDVNRNSLVAGSYGRIAGKQPIVAIPTAAANGTAINDLVVGSTYQLTSGQNFTRTLLITDEIKASLVEAAGGTTHVLVNNIVTAGTSTNGIATNLIFLSLQDRSVYVDYQPSRFNRIDLYLTKGFPTSVIPTNPVNARDGEGYGRSLNLWYEATEGQRLYNLRHTCDPVVKYPSDIDQNGKYNVYNILHGRSEQVDIGNVVVSPYREIVLIPSSNADLITAFETDLNTWLASAGKQAIQSN